VVSKRSPTPIVVKRFQTLRGACHTAWVESEPVDTLDRLLARQYGVVSRAQARRFGLTDRQIEHRVKTGRFIAIGRGVYRVSSAPRTDLGDVLAATLRTGGVASHQSAAALYALIDKHPRIPEVTVGATESYRGGVVAHRSADLDPTDIVLVDGVRATSATRTLLDIAGRLPLRRLETITHQAIMRGLTDRDRLVDQVERVSRPGRAGGPKMRTVLERLGPNDACESPLETLLLQELLDHGLPAPARQHQVMISGRTLRLDLAYPAEKIALEADGYAFHTDRKSFDRDRSRGNLLALDGWLALHFTSDHLRGSPGSAARQVREALDMRRSRSG
jgi:very-short-patch-repair endonuclease